MNPQPQPSGPRQGLLISVCDRCGRNCQAGKADPKARMLRVSETGEGLCLDCAVTEWLRNTPPLCYQLDGGTGTKRMREEQEFWDRSRRGDENHGPQMLLIPMIQEQFGRIMLAAFAQAAIESVNWKWIVDQWEMPFPKRRKARKKKR